MMIVKEELNKITVRKCSDVPDWPILKFLYDRMTEGKIWCCWYSGFENSIDQAMPDSTPEKVIIKKMKRLIDRGLVSGCGCGCRGDYEITKQGVEWLNNNTIFHVDITKEPITTQPHPRQPLIP